jgi:hypothetical protein
MKRIASVALPLVPPGVSAAEHPLLQPQCKLATESEGLHHRETTIILSPQGDCSGRLNLRTPQVKVRRRWGVWDQPTHECRGATVYARAILTGAGRLDRVVVQYREETMVHFEAATSLMVASTGVVAMWCGGAPMCSLMVGRTDQLPGTVAMSASALPVGGEGEPTPCSPVLEV